MFKISCFAIVLLAAPVAHGQGRLEGRGIARSFVSEKYGFSIAVPSGWSVSTALDTPVYFYSSSPGRFVQDKIPKGGAVITVEAHDTMSGLSRSASTPSEWAVADARIESSGNPPATPLDMPKESGVSRAVMSSYAEATFSPDEQIQQMVAIFWEFKQKLFAAHLRYVAGDPNGPKFKALFLETVRGIRPLEKADKH